MSNNPAFVATPVILRGQVSVANTNRDGTGTLVDLAGGTPAAMTTAAPANGRRIDSIEVQALGTTTAGMVRVFMNNGATSLLLREILISAITPSGNTKAFWSETVFARGLVVPSGWKLQAATNNAETFNVAAIGGDF